MNDTMYDLVIIGGGPGGYVAAIHAAKNKLNVACIDKMAFGGTCLNIGCIPSKALLDSSELFYETKHSFSSHGIKVDKVELDLTTMMTRKDEVVQQMTRGVNGLFKKYKVHGFQGLGKVKDKNIVEIHGTEKTIEISTKNIILASGSVPIELPNLPFDNKHIVNSTDALEFDSVPKRMVVVGAGAIGLELGSVWSRLGSEVMVVEMQDSIVPGMDRELSKYLKRYLEKQGLKFLMQSKVTKSDIQSGQVQLTIETNEDEQQEQCDKVLVAVGRRALTETLGIENNGININQKGQIEVNQHFQTSSENIFAIGDVIGGKMLAHKAEDEGIAVVDYILGKPSHVNYDVIPNVVYTHPEFASVGLTEEQVKEQETPYKVGKFPFMANGRAQAMGSPEGWVKIISHEETDRVLGIHILSARASDIIAECVLAMEYSASSEDIARTCHAHPTMPEAIKEAALAVNQMQIHT